MKSRIAEWILSLALPPEQAAAVVGDFTEDASRRGGVWFWSCVFRTLFARIWSDLTESPMTTARLGLIGLARNLLVVVGFCAWIYLLLKWPHPHDSFHGDIRWSWNVLMFNHALSPAEPRLFLRWQIGVVWFFLYSVRLVQTACWLARQAPGREVAGCISIVLMGWIAIVLTVRFSPNMAFDPGFFLLSVVNDIILCSTVVWMRRQSFPVARMG